MATKPSTLEKLEEGDIFLFYRPRIAAHEVHGWSDVQRFYMVLAAKWPLRIYRLFVIGRKKLPQLVKGRQHPDRRNWAVVVLVSDDPGDIRSELAVYEYETRTRGRRFVPAAKPLGEGRYQLVRHRDHTELVYALELPRPVGPAQREFEIRQEAGYIIAVKNPEISTPGTPSTKYPPAYPERLRRKFGRHRWIDVEPDLLDHENAQLLLLAAHSEEVEDELGVHIDTEDEELSTAEVCRELRVSCERNKVTPLLQGTFPEHEEEK
jgi:hypothetical protein